MLNAGGIAGELPVARMQWSNVSVRSSGIEASSPASLRVVLFSNTPPGVNDLHVAALGELLEAPGKRRDDFFLPLRGPC